VYGFTEADWSRVSIEKKDGRQVKSLDFEIAATNDQLIQVENKGGSTQDNRRKASSISNHRANIAEKKRAIAEMALGSTKPDVARYGTITVLDPREDGFVRCWLVDPEADKIPLQPRRFRILTRMAFLSRWISLVSPRSPLAAALATRARALAQITEPYELDSVPLVRGTGEPFEYRFIGTRAIHSTFFANKSKVTDGPAGGVVIELRRGMLAFVGIREELVDLAARQEFAEILSYEREAGIVRKSIECVFHDSRFRRLSLPPRLAESARGAGTYRSITVSGNLHYSRSGLVFGYLPLNR